MRNGFKFRIIFSSPNFEFFIFPLSITPIDDRETPLVTSTASCMTTHHLNMPERAWRWVLLAALLGCHVDVARGFSVGGRWSFTKTVTTGTQQYHDEVAAAFNRRSHDQSFTYTPRKVLEAAASTAAAAAAVAAVAVPSVV